MIAPEILRILPTDTTTTRLRDEMNHIQEPGFQPSAELTQRHARIVSTREGPNLLLPDGIFFDRIGYRCAEFVFFAIEQQPWITVDSDGLPQVPHSVFYDTVATLEKHGYRARNNDEPLEEEDVVAYGLLADGHPDSLQWFFVTLHFAIITTIASEPIVQGKLEQDDVAEHALDIPPSDYGNHAIIFTRRDRA